MNRRQLRQAQGQILPIFALALVAIVAMVGLVLDGGSVSAQRRSQQNAADLAALAAANDLIVNQGSAAWVATAQSVTEKNGFKDGSNGVTVNVTCKNCPGQASDPNAAGVQVTVGITAPHRNTFSGIFGFTNWDVSTTATAKTGWADTGTGPAPFVISNENFDSEGNALVCKDADHQCVLTHPVDDAPPVINEFVWTDFGFDKDCKAIGNVNDSDLQAYMSGRADFELTLEIGCYIAQHNMGVMNNIVAALEALAPITFPIPVVDPSGAYVGWTAFVLTSADAGGRGGELRGYFPPASKAHFQQLDVSGAGFGSSSFGGFYTLKLIN